MSFPVVHLVFFTLCALCTFTSSAPAPPFATPAIETLLLGPPQQRTILGDIVEILPQRRTILGDIVDILSAFNFNFPALEDCMQRVNCEGFCNRTLAGEIFRPPVSLIADANRDLDQGG